MKDVQALCHRHHRAPVLKPSELITNYYAENRWTEWKSLNYLRTDVGRSKDFLQLGCPLLEQTCTARDLADYNDTDNEPNLMLSGLDKKKHQIGLLKKFDFLAMPPFSETISKDVLIIIEEGKVPNIKKLYRYVIKLVNFVDLLLKCLHLAVRPKQN